MSPRYFFPLINIILILFSSILYSAEVSLNTLLHELDNEQALYKKTLDESAGVAIVYTRHDLDMMQARTLKDVLKSVRFLSYGEGVVGEAVLSPAGSSHPLSAMYRLYIDGHEVSSPIFGSAVLQFGEMDLGFVDHIEIYQGGNAIAFGNEPGLVTIRVYSKDPKREGGSTLTLLTDTLKSRQGRLCYARVDENASLLGYFSGGTAKREKISAHDREYSKDGESFTFYGKYERPDTFKVTAAHFRERKDAFAGVGLAQLPEDPNRISWQHSFLNFTWRLPQQTRFDLSADISSHRMEFSDEGGIWIVGARQPFQRLDAQFGEKVFKASLKGKIDHDNGDLKWGLESIYKGYTIDHITTDGASYDERKGPSHLMIYSAFAEESWHVTPTNLLIGTFKGDYIRDNLSKSDFEVSTRIGWIHLFSLESSFKLFYNRTYLYPGFSYTSPYPKVFEPNPDLNPEHFQNLIGEWKYETQKHTVTLGALWQKKSDAIVIDSIHRTFVNSDIKHRAAKVYFDYAYAFNPLNRIEMEYYRGWLLNDSEVRSPLSGGYLRLYNTVGKWDIFNELVYRQGYTYPLADRYGGPIKVRNGWDYTLGLQWHPHHNLTLSIKGENLLNRALESPVYGLDTVPVFDRKVTFGLEYFF